MGKRKGTVAGKIVVGIFLLQNNYVGWKRMESSRRLYDGEISCMVNSRGLFRDEDKKAENFQGYYIK